MRPQDYSFAVPFWHRKLINHQVNINLYKIEVAFLNLKKPKCTQYIHKKINSLKSQIATSKILSFSNLTSQNVISSF